MSTFYGNFLVVFFDEFECLKADFWLFLKKVIAVELQIVVILFIFPLISLNFFYVFIVSFLDKDSSYSRTSVSPAAPELQLEMLQVVIPGETGVAGATGVAGETGVFSSSFFIAFLKFCVK
jgi:hypothetical protein